MEHRCAQAGHWGTATVQGRWVGRHLDKVSEARGALRERCASRLVLAHRIKCQQPDHVLCIQRACALRSTHAVQHPHYCPSTCAAHAAGHFTYVVHYGAHVSSIIHCMLPLNSSVLSHPVVPLHGSRCESCSPAALYSVPAPAPLCLMHLSCACKKAVSVPT